MITGNPVDLKYVRKRYSGSKTWSKFVTANAVMPKGASIFACREAYPFGVKWVKAACKGLVIAMV